jgi:hypothetical protein
MTAAADEITTLFQDVVEATDEDLDGTDTVEAYGKAERARGVMLAFEAAQDAHAGGRQADATDGVAGRLRDALAALRGRETGGRGATGTNTDLDELARVVEDATDVVDAWADALRDDLADRHADNHDDARMFQ